MIKMMTIDYCGDGDDDDGPAVTRVGAMVAMAIERFAALLMKMMSQIQNLHC